MFGKIAVIQFPNALIVLKSNLASYYDVYYNLFSDIITHSKTKTTQVINLSLKSMLNQFHWKKIKNFKKIK